MAWSRLPVELGPVDRGGEVRSVLVASRLNSAEGRRISSQGVEPVDSLVLWLRRIPGWRWAGRDVLAESARGRCGFPARRALEEQELHM